MPTYGYQCKDCKHEFSVFQSMKDDAISVCPECEGSVKRLLYPVGIVFKGSGWYINDSRKPDPSESGNSSDSKSESKDGDSKSSESSDSAKTDSKTDTKSESGTSDKSESKSDAGGSKATAPAGASTK